MQQHAGQCIAVALTARKHPNRLEHVVFGEKEAAQHAPQFGHGLLRGYIGEVVEHAPRGIELLVLVLREIVRFHVVA